MKAQKIKNWAKANSDIVVFDVCLISVIRAQDNSLLRENEIFKFQACNNSNFIKILEMSIRAYEF